MEHSQSNTESKTKQNRTTLNKGEENRSIGLKTKKQHKKEQNKTKPNKTE